ncbi:hypothetical protein PC128_g24363 [Phytophthora cactorum]|nr:hypothetical protein PC128_g24363 [Phytophthora cactorum]
MVAPVSPNETRPLLLQQEHETLAAIADCHELKPREPEPDAAKELQTLLALVYPVVGTTVLEFLPGPTCIVLAGHMDSPYTQQYVDAATLSTMLMNLTNYSDLFRPLVGVGYVVFSSEWRQAI